MEVALIVLGAVALLALAACVWLFAGRSGLNAELAAARAEARRAEEERARDAARRQGELEHSAGEISHLRHQLDEEQAGAADFQAQCARLQEQNAAAEQRFQIEFEAFRSKYEDQRRAQDRLLEDRETKLREMDARMSETFRSLAAEVMSKSNVDFLRLAEERMRLQNTQSLAELEKKRLSVEELIKPMSETLRKTDAKLAEIDRSRAETAATISQQLRGMAEANAALRDETGKLSNALRKPQVRGRYGEIQLRRVAELAGMAAYCDFAEQDQTRDADGHAARPDMIVRLPNERTVVVDAKTNIHAYLEAIDASTPEESEAHLDRFAKHVADQAAALAGKQYWSRYEGSPEFVVMFIPGDQFIDAALSRRADLLDKAAEQGVLLASPSTLIGLLRAVAVGYKEQRLAKAAEELRRLGKEFHDRAATAYGHVATIGKALASAVDGYNKFAGSYETRLLPTLRKFEDEGAKSSKDVPELGEIVVKPKRLEADIH